MNATAARLSAKAAKATAAALLRVRAPRKGAWRGTYIAKEESPGQWRVVQSRSDPMRLFVEALRLEFSWAGTLDSDGGSIPRILQKSPHLRLRPDAFLKSYFLHDAAYRAAALFVRAPEAGNRWREISLDRREADALLYCGLCAEGATLAEAQAIYRACRLFAWRAWNAHRLRKEKEAES